jgi:signal transduction histidine kinase
VRWTPSRPQALDVVLALAVAVLTATGTWFAGQNQPDTRPLDLLGWLLVLAGPALLVLLRERPVLVFGLVTALLLGYWSLGYPFGPAFLAALVALAVAVVDGHRRAAYTITAAAFLASVLLYLLVHPGEGLPVTGAAGWLAWLVTFVAGCELWRARRERLVHERAVREEGRRRHGAEERLRIAQELHDSLGHHVSLINVQAGVALYLIDEDPGQARAALAVIKQASRDLLVDMRAALGVLRAVDEQPPRAPTAGLDRLDGLLADNRAAGLPVALDVRGAPRRLPASIDHAAYRIVQEALTNVRRHAAASTATVRLRYTDDRLEVQIDDDGNGFPGTTPPGGGSGVAGMRERAAALDGSLIVGPRPGGGFRVRAELPLGSGPVEDAP